MTWPTSAAKAKRLSFAKLSVSICGNQQFCLRASHRIAEKDQTNSSRGLSLTTLFSILTSKPVEVMLLRAVNREKFPQRLDKSRAIKSVKDSILHATAAHATAFWYI